MNNFNRDNYGKSLAGMGFNYHNIIRINSEIISNKVYPKQLDYYMNNLARRGDIDIIWACIEPDIDKINNYVHKDSNNVHFAWKSSNTLSKHQLANYMKLNRVYLKDTRPIINHMSYFTKHIGKSLSYHNFYC